MAAQNVKLPDIGEGVTEGELVKWLVKAGDSVQADQPIAEVMTDKATVEVPTPYAGTVKELKFKEGDVIPIETVIAVLESGVGAATAGGGAGASTSAKAGAGAKTGSGAGAGVRAAVEASSNKGAVPPPPQEIRTATQASPPSKMALPETYEVSSRTPSGSQQGAGMEVYPPAAESRVLATPATRRLARETGVDINQLQGTGLAGRVTRDDVVKAKGVGGTMAPPAGAVTGTGASAGSGSVTSMGTRALLRDIPRPAVISQPGAGEDRVPIRGVRKKIAENMQMAKHIIPHFTLMEEARVDELVRLRAQAKEAAERYGVKVTYLPFIMKALIATCREFPMFNASMDDQAGEIVYKKYFNLGFAADTPNGLMVPVVKNADFKTVLQISQEIQQLAAKAREGKLGLDDMRGATITVTNIGSVGGVYATPIINHPEVAILGVYKIQDKPIWNGAEFERGQVMNFTITCDHRLIDGAVAANFMKAFVARVENPSQLMLDMI
ncbi:MAG: dihydrolipoamide acetyltransferase family protein [Bdellovibrionales bacterium]